jgi:hypothetical protein
MRDVRPFLMHNRKLLGWKTTVRDTGLRTGDMLVNES